MNLRKHKRRAYVGMTRRLRVIGPIFEPLPGFPGMWRRLQWLAMIKGFRRDGGISGRFWFRNDSYASTHPFSAASLGINVSICVMPRLS